MNVTKPSEPRRVVTAPAPSNPALYPSVLNVDCADDEDVEWQWTETVAGRFVFGYHIVSRQDRRPR